MKTIELTDEDAMMIAINELEEIESLVGRAYWRLKIVEKYLPSCANELWKSAKDSVERADQYVTDIINLLDRKDETPD